MLRLCLLAHNAAFLPVCSAALPVCFSKRKFVWIKDHTDIFPGIGIPYQTWLVADTLKRGQGYALTVTSRCGQGFKLACCRHLAAANKLFYSVQRFWWSCGDTAGIETERAFFLTIAVSDVENDDMLPGRICF